MDIADIAQENTDGFLENALKKRQMLTIPFSGHCLSCGDPVHKRRYCDSFCREDHEKSMIRNMRG